MNRSLETMNGFTFDAAHNRAVCNKCGWLTKLPRVVSRAFAARLVTHRSAC